LWETGFASSDLRCLPTVDNNNNIDNNDDDDNNTDNNHDDDGLVGSEGAL
jgi:hypothetical protein